MPDGAERARYLCLRFRSETRHPRWAELTRAKAGFWQLVVGQSLGLHDVEAIPKARLNPSGSAHRVLGAHLSGG